MTAVDANETNTISNNKGGNKSNNDVSSKIISPSTPSQQQQQQQKSGAGERSSSNGAVETVTAQSGNTIPTSKSSAADPTTNVSSGNAISNTNKNNTTTEEKPEPVGNRIVSISEVALSAKSKSVTPARKEELLQQARASRLEWIRQVPFPYLVVSSSTRTTSSSASGDAAADDDVVVVDPLETVRKSHAGRQMPTALQVLDYLYGFPDHADETAAEHIAELLAHPNDDDDDEYDVSNAIPTPEQAREMTLEENEKNDDVSNHNRQETRLVLSSYHLFLQKLADPTASVLVQWMRTFCRNLVHSQQQQQQQQPIPFEEAKATLITMIQSYILSTLDAIQAHALWKEDLSTAKSTAKATNFAAKTSSFYASTEDSFLWTKRSFESFLYGQCRYHIDTVLWTPEMERKEQEWCDRIQALQFVTAQHLEVACLQEYDRSQLSNVILQEPMEALRSVSLYHAPFEKLQRVLAVYRSINVALSKTLNRNNADHSKTTDQDPQQTTTKPSPPPKKRLPSADDVLPTLILTVLYGKPERLLYHLQLIEDFCPPEQLRGEAGYAYTNLYGAIQFLSDLNIHDDSSQQQQQQPPENLSITAEEFRQGLATCRAAAKERMTQQEEQQSKQPSQQQQGSNHSTISFMNPLSPTWLPPEITARDVYTARERGETIGIDWAMRQYRQSRAEQDRLFWEDDDDEDIQNVISSETQPSDAAPPPTNGLVRETSSSGDVATTTAATAAAGHLPPSGFRRTYTFLSLQPEDVKVTDLPRLLEEYRMMVHTTEELLAERQAKLSSEKKQQMNQDERELYERVKTVDPSLLASTAAASSPSKRFSTTTAATTTSSSATQDYGGGSNTNKKI